MKPHDQSPVHRDALLIDVLRAIRVRDLMTQGREFVSFEPSTPAAEMLRQINQATWQEVFPVVDGVKMIGLVSTHATRVLATDGHEMPWALAADIMQPPLSVRPEDDLRVATERLVANGLREIPVVDDSEAVIGFLDERDVAKIYLNAEARLESSRTPPLGTSRSPEARKSGSLRDAR